MPVPGVRVIRVTGMLGRAGAARLLRQIDSQLSLVRADHLHLTAVPAHLDAVHAIECGASKAMAHARYGCARMGIAFALAGTCRALQSAAPQVRADLRYLRAFPSTDVAVAELTRRGTATALPPLGRAHRRIHNSPTEGTPDVRPN